MDYPIRPGEIAGTLPAGFDAGLYFIGRVRTPWASRSDCPRRGAHDGPICRIEIDPSWRPALAGLDGREFVQILYFMHLARRDLLLQSPKGREGTIGTFALRSPVRPNPIASSIVKLEAVAPEGLVVRGLDCVDGTPLLDIKPHFQS
ncbi:MAG TPA: SAM-dependent methyltransferase [Rhodoblastus sp.]|nr:SAM-dependent methyltransferase [Rhodoblastus sp.]